MNVLSGQPLGLFNPTLARTNRQAAGWSHLSARLHRCTVASRLPCEPSVGGTTRIEPPSCAATEVTNRIIVTSTNKCVIGSVMIQPKVHLRLPCYDFCPVQATAIKLVLTKDNAETSNSSDP
uniref:Uncharacterized protein n=1 Tax=Bursaphelenchus xylophilus TaxID=6326 RepID=A0A1I7SJA8_BURXY